MSGKLEGTVLGKVLVSISNSINKWFENRTFFVLCAIFGFSAFYLRSLDKQLHEITSQTVPDNRFNYTQLELLDYFSKLGGSELYRNYLITEFIVAFSLCTLASFTISFLGFTLVQAENEMSRQLVQKGLAPLVFPFRAILLNLVPFVVLSFEAAENVSMIVCLYTRHELFLTHAGTLTRYKWMGIRIGFIFTMMVLLQGWAKVFGHWLMNRNSKAQEGQTPTRDVKDKPRGLYKANQLGKETWKNK